MSDSLQTDSVIPAKPSAFKRAIRKFMNFSDFDTLYISHNRYNYALMTTHFSNFEYYSEDPLVAGKSGAAMVRGMQSEHIGASVKHFCCNNKETNRKDSDSRVSERALREIYLKAFEIIVKEADPYTIMSSYNLINGVQASENKDLLTGILRGEWDFKGMVTTDWWTHGEHYRETKAGNDIKMANGYEERVQEAFEKGYITRDEIALCAKRILTMILRMD